MGGLKVFVFFSFCSVWTVIHMLELKGYALWKIIICGSYGIMFLIFRHEKRRKKLTNNNNAFCFVYKNSVDGATYPSFIQELFYVCLWFFKVSFFFTARKSKDSVVNKDTEKDFVINSVFSHFTLKFTVPLTNRFKLWRFELFFIWIKNFKFDNLNEKFKLLFDSNNFN